MFFYFQSSNPSTLDKFQNKGSEQHREDWMGMTGMIRTYSKDESKTNSKTKEKNRLDSYNPATSGRELNPYWKDGGTGLPQTSNDLRQSKQFIKPKRDDDKDYYKKSYYTKDYKDLSKDVDKKTTFHRNNNISHNSGNWRKSHEISKSSDIKSSSMIIIYFIINIIIWH